MAGRPRKAEPEVALAAAMNAFWEKGYESTSVRPHGGNRLTQSEPL